MRIDKNVGNRFKIFLEKIKLIFYYIEVMDEKRYFNYLPLETISEEEELKKNPASCRIYFLFGIMVGGLLSQIFLKKFIFL